MLVQGARFSTIFTSVAHIRLTKITKARQFCCTGSSMIGTTNKTMKMASMIIKVKNVELKSQRGHVSLPTGVITSFVSKPSGSSPCNRAFDGSWSPPSKVLRIPIFAACAFRSTPIISRHTVLRSHTTCSRRCNRNSLRAALMSPFETT